MMRRLIKMLLCIFGQIGSLGAMTQNAPELSGLDRSPYDPTVYSQDELEQALEAGHLTPSQALQLHDEGHNWEITVDRNR
jgi:hypothetical protein